jgi:hypothetical protein
MALYELRTYTLRVGAMAGDEMSRPTALKAVSSST